MKWNRRVLKAQGKAAFRRNYWRGVLAALVLTFVLAGGAALSGNSIEDNIDITTNDSSKDENVRPDSNNPDGWEYWQDYGDSSSGGNFSEIPGQGGSGSGSFGQYGQVPDITEDNSHVEKAEAGAGTVVAAIFGVLAVIAAVAVSVLLKIFIGNPLEIGAKRFFVKNLRREPGQISELGYVFDHSWKNAGVTLFFRDLYTCLWGLLFIIPGIVKAYEYRMIPYLLAEDPGMDRKTAFALSRQMMHGQKWHTFVLDLSFIGWDILSVLTLGLVGLFWSNPYQYSTGAALYATLRYLRPQQEAPAGGSNPYNPYPAAPGSTASDVPFTEAVSVNDGQFAESAPASDAAWTESAPEENPAFTENAPAEEAPAAEEPEIDNPTEDQ